MKHLYLRFCPILVDGVMPVGSRGVEYFAFYGFPPTTHHVVPFEIDYGFFSQSIPQAEIQSFRPGTQHSDGSTTRHLQRTP